MITAFVSFYYLPTDPWSASFWYLLSGFLDAIDGHLARMLDQSKNSVCIVFLPVSVIWIFELYHVPVFPVGITFKWILTSLMVKICHENYGRDSEIWNVYDQNLFLRVYMIRVFIMLMAKHIFWTGSKLGGMLDMLIDRCATMCLMAALCHFYPKYMLFFQFSMALDITSHWFHVQR